MVLILIRIRLRLWQSLVLFFLLGCWGQKDKSTEVSIVWEGDRATGIIIPSHYLRGSSTDSAKYLLHVHLSGPGDYPAILGDYETFDDDVLFKPLIPLTPGLTYEVRFSGDPIGKIEVPASLSTNASKLVAIYPSQDSLPQNLLKFYFEFSRPMREGQALKHITLLRNNTDTITGAFLDLKPELWNSDYTRLTVWLDPGRIKRDLQPNMRLGAPLDAAAHYSLIVEAGWPDTYGSVVNQSTQKNFYVTNRDSISPGLEGWMIQTPSVNTRDPLLVNFHESLDCVLLKEALFITNSHGERVAGDIELQNEESTLLFRPQEPWLKGSFVLQSEGRLEDLAGNNLNRPFDRDVTADAASAAKEVFTREFQIQ